MNEGLGGVELVAVVVGGFRGGEITASKVGVLPVRRPICGQVWVHAASYCQVAINSPRPAGHGLQIVLSWDPDTTRTNDFAILSTMEAVPSITILKTL